MITGGAVTHGWSLCCNGTPGVGYDGLRAGANVNTWQFADGRTRRRVNKVIGDYVTSQLRAFGWI